jgi:hypothetical protein
MSVSQTALYVRLRAFLAGSVWRDAVLPTIGIRLTILGGSFLLALLFRPDVLRPEDPLAIWNRWDVAHYLEVASRGYVDPNRSVVFPLYPSLIAIGSLMFPPLVAAMAISFVATVAAAAGLYQLVRWDHGPVAARAAVLAMNAFPTAYWLSAAYTDAVFLAFVVWSLLAAQRERWEQAGIFALLASATRLQGALLAPALMLEYVLLYRRLGRSMLWLALGGGGLLAYLGINLAAYGSPLFFLHIQRETFRLENVAPWTVIQGLLNGVSTSARGETWVTLYVAPLVSYVVLALATAWSCVSRPFRASYAVYAGLSLVTLLTLSWPISMPRYVLGVAPLFVGLGLVSRRPDIGPAWLVMSTVLLGAFLTLLVIGHWAF